MATETLGLRYIDAQYLLDWLSMSTMPKSNKIPEAVFILGSGSNAPAHAASQHLINTANEGRKTPVFFTSAGGTFGGNVVFGRPEVEEYRRILLENGISGAYLHSPPREQWTTNTLTEARAAIPFIKRVLGGAPACVGLFARSVHMRRVLVTFAKQHPGVEFVLFPDNETCTVELLPRMLQEVARLVMYAKKGDILETTFPLEALTICAQILELPGMISRLSAEEFTAIESLLCVEKLCATPAIRWLVLFPQTPHPRGMPRGWGFLFYM